MQKKLVGVFKHLWDIATVLLDLVSFFSLSLYHRYFDILLGGMVKETDVYTESHRVHPVKEGKLAPAITCSLDDCHEKV